MKGVNFKQLHKDPDFRAFCRKQPAWLLWIGNWYSLVALYLENKHG